VVAGDCVATELCGRAGDPLPSGRWSFSFGLFVRLEVWIFGDGGFGVSRSSAFRFREFRCRVGLWRCVMACASGEGFWL